MKAALIDRQRRRFRVASLRRPRENAPSVHVVSVQRWERILSGEVLSERWYAQVPRHFGVGRVSACHYVEESQGSSIWNAIIKATWVKEVIYENCTLPNDGDLYKEKWQMENDGE